MKSLRVFFYLAPLALLFSCGSATKETPTGYKFTVVKKGDGKVVKPGEVMILSMAIVDAKDSIWYDNRTTDYPEFVKIREESVKNTEHGVAESFRMLSKGDSIAFPMSAADIFTLVWRMPVPPYVDAKSNFTFQIKCIDIMDDAGAMAFRAKCDSVHNIKEQERYAEEMKNSAARDAELASYYKEQLGKDTLIIDNYLKSKGMRAKTTASGLRYIIKKNGSGQPPQTGDYVNVKYAGQTLDGKEFDSGEIPFAANQGAVIKGWDEIILLMKPGTALTVFIPSPLGYGKFGSPPVIMPDAVLMFDMELVSIQKQQ
jgi:FKBP-type peptidyl-prolyl cis-trans isomerase FkpA